MNLRQEVDNGLIFSQAGAQAVIEGAVELLQATR